MDHSILIAGCGYVGSHLALSLLETGRSVLGLRRNVAALPQGVLPVAADLRDPGSLPEVPSLAELVYCPSAGGRNEANYRAAYVDGVDRLADALGSRADGLRRAVYVSSTAVYGDDYGADEVDELTEPRSPSPTGRILLEGERRFRERFPQGVVLRLAGIYGPTRRRLVQQVLDGGPFDSPAEAIGNRIHRDDCAGAIAHLLTLPRPEALYVGVDRAAVPLGEVRAFVARLAGLRGEDFEPRGPATGKRLRATRLLASGYRFRVPTYAEGYPAIVAETLAARASDARGA